MTDIVKRLRDPVNNWNSGGRFEAADEIERLRAAVDIARTALLKIERQSEEARATITAEIEASK